MLELERGLTIIGADIGTAGDVGAILTAIRGILRANPAKLTEQPSPAAYDEAKPETWSEVIKVGAITVDIAESRNMIIRTAGGGSLMIQYTDRHDLLCAIQRYLELETMAGKP